MPEIRYEDDPDLYEQNNLNKVWADRDQYIANILARRRGKKADQQEKHESHCIGNTTFLTTTFANGATSTVGLDSDGDILLPSKSGKSSKKSQAVENPRFIDIEGYPLLRYDMWRKCAMIREEPNGLPCAVERPWNLIYMRDNGVPKSTIVEASRYLISRIVNIVGEL